MASSGLPARSLKNCLRLVRVSVAPLSFLLPVISTPKVLKSLIQRRYHAQSRAFAREDSFDGKLALHTTDWPRSRGDVGSDSDFDVCRIAGARTGAARISRPCRCRRGDADFPDQSRLPNVPRVGGRWAKDGHPD